MVGEHERDRKEHFSLAVCFRISIGIKELEFAHSSSVRAPDSEKCRVCGWGRGAAYKIETHFLDGVFDRPLPAAAYEGGVSE